jgi:probable blue pigment (indigoidine) exporter
VRALPAGLALLALRWQLPSGVWWWRIGVLGMLNIGLFFPLLFVAAERVPGGVGGVVGVTLLVVRASSHVDSRAGLARGRSARRGAARQAADPGSGTMAPWQHRGGSRRPETFTCRRVAACPTG